MALVELRGLLDMRCQQRTGEAGKKAGFTGEYKGRHV
jgi:hypothetical protein